MLFPKQGARRNLPEAFGAEFSWRQFKLAGKITDETYVTSDSFGESYVQGYGDLADLFSLLVLIFALTLFAGCGGGTTVTPLSADNLNLVFVSSEDLAYSAAGDVDSRTANLTNRGLQRTLLMGDYLTNRSWGRRMLPAFTRCGR